jgi:X-X-X-Leu-X-X-Gly heptad repeat protein
MKKKGGKLAGGATRLGGGNTKLSGGQTKLASGRTKMNVGGKGLEFRASNEDATLKMFGLSEAKIEAPPAI